MSSSDDDLPLCIDNINGGRWVDGKSWKPYGCKLQNYLYPELMKCFEKLQGDITWFVLHTSKSILLSYFPYF